MSGTHDVHPIRSTGNVPRMPTVLLVESEHDARGMYAEYLRLRGFRAIEIDNTEDGAALGHTADVVITGLHVAGRFDGIELIRRLRTDRRTADTPIVVLTAWTLERDRHRAYAAGCDGFLLKPCPLEALHTEIRRVISEQFTRHA